MSDESGTWLSSWDHIAHILLSSVYFYCLVIALVRILGKRVTSQMNNFDWIISVVVGSIAASGVLLRNVSVFDATAAILTLATLQWLVTWLVMRFPVLDAVVKTTPTVLTHKGNFLREAMRKERVSEAEIRSVLRDKGYTHPEDANWVILENDGSVSVTPRRDLRWSEAELMTDVTSHDGLD